MKNQYVGDIGDFTKLGLLRILQKTGLSLGVNWYLTPDDTRTDGKYIAYLQQPSHAPDCELFRMLQQLVRKKDRTVNALEASGLLGHARFVNEPLDFALCADKEERRLHRGAWHMQSLKCLAGCDIVFLDPDNGLEVASVKPWGTNGNKYVTYAEAAEYYRNGASVIVYNHRDRSPHQRYLERLLCFRQMDSTKQATLRVLRAFRISVRDYVCIIQPSHAALVQKCFSEIAHSTWQQYMREIDLS